MWSWICHAQYAPFLTASSLWSAILQRVPEKIVPVASYGESQVEARIQSLRFEDKTKLLRALIAELDGPADADVERAWLMEAQRRYREVLEGKVKPIPGERVFENVRARLKQ